MVYNKPTLTGGTTLHTPRIGHRQNESLHRARLQPTKWKGPPSKTWQTKIYHKYIYIYIQCEAPKIAKLVYNSNNYGLWYL